MSEQTEPLLEDSHVEIEPSHEELLQSVGKTESQTDVRLRMRVHPELRTPENMAKIKTSLENHPDVKSVRVNERTGSVVIEHEPKHNGHKLFWEAVNEVELVAEGTLDLPDEESGEDPTEKLEQQLADFSYKIDRAIYKRSGENLHLGLLIPGSIAGIGIAQIAIFGIGLELLPGPVLLWIAYDIYRRIGKEPPFVTKEKAENSAQEDAIPTDEAVEELEQGDPGTSINMGKMQLQN